MPKRFTDTNKYKKKFIRGLPGPYKLLWDYLYHDCDHAGIWHKDFEIAQIMIGKDMPINEVTALLLFNEGEERIKILDAGFKWLILPFASFQYGKLNPENRLHASVLNILDKVLASPLEAPAKGAKDKDKDKDKDKEEGGVGETKKPLTDIQKIVRVYKIVTGIEKDDTAWDKVHFARCAKSAKLLLDYLGSWKNAGDCIQDIYEKLTAKGLTVTIETVVKHSADWKKDYLEKEAKHGGIHMSSDGSSQANR